MVAVSPVRRTRTPQGLRKRTMLPTFRLRRRQSWAAHRARHYVQLLQAALVSVAAPAAAAMALCVGLRAL